jgi:hypothetical protein
MGCEGSGRAQSRRCQEGATARTMSIRECRDAESALFASSVLVGCAQEEGGMGEKQKKGVRVRAKKGDQLGLET